VPGSTPRPRGITGLSMFLIAGAVIAGASAVSLAIPGGLLEPMWRLKPAALVTLRSLGPASVALMAAVAVVCAVAAFGLWRGARWGHRLAFVVLTINLVGDGLAAATGLESRGWAGVLIGALLLAYLSSAGVRRHFGSRRDGA